MKKEYVSEALMVCHQSAESLLRMGIIGADDMKEFDEGCLVSPPRKPRESKGTATAQKPVPIYAAPAK
jgi:DNA-binding transcriptional regulator YiaG